jgi:hypothetical protein
VKNKRWCRHKYANSMNKISLIIIELVSLVILLTNQSFAQNDKLTKKLFKGIRKHDVESVKELLSNGANVNAVDDWKETVLERAIEYSDTNIVKEVLKYNPKYQSDILFKSYSSAIYSCNAAMIAFVISKLDIPKDSQNYEHKTLLDLALLQMCNKVADTLIKLGFKTQFDIHSSPTSDALNLNLKYERQIATEVMSKGHSYTINSLLSITEWMATKSDSGTIYLSYNNAHNLLSEDVYVLVKRLNFSWTDDIWRRQYIIFQKLVNGKTGQVISESTHSFYPGIHFK